MMIDMVEYSIKNKNPGISSAIGQYENSRRLGGLYKISGKIKAGEERFKEFLRSSIEAQGIKECIKENAHKAANYALALTPIPFYRAIENEVELGRSENPCNNSGRLRKAGRWIKENPAKTALITANALWYGYLAYFYTASFANVYSDNVVSSLITKSNRLQAGINLNWPPLTPHSYGPYTPSAPISSLPSPQKELTIFAKDLYNDPFTKFAAIGGPLVADNVPLGLAANEVDKHFFQKKKG
jgi:hypothetical protein